MWRSYELLRPLTDASSEASVSGVVDITIEHGSVARIVALHDPGRVLEFPQIFFRNRAISGRARLLRFVRGGRCRFLVALTRVFVNDFLVSFVPPLEFLVADSGPGDID